MSIVELYFFFFGLTLIFQWEFNFKDSLNIAGVGEQTWGEVSKSNSKKKVALANTICLINAFMNDNE